MQICDASELTLAYKALEFVPVPARGIQYATLREKLLDHCELWHAAAKFTEPPPKGIQLIRDILHKNARPKTL